MHDNEGTISQEETRRDVTRITPFTEKFFVRMDVTRRFRSW